MVLALAMGADFIMMGRYFARFDEKSYPQADGKRQLHERILGQKVPTVPGSSVTTWAAATAFEEGVDSFVPYAGLKDNLNITLGKIKSTMNSCGVISLDDLKQNAKITLVSHQYC